VTLPIGPRNLEAIGDVPGTVLFDNGSEFVVHYSTPLTDKAFVLRSKSNGRCPLGPRASGECGKRDTLAETIIYRPDVTSPRENEELISQFSI
jgi:hypothetical protein